MPLLAVPAGELAEGAQGQEALSPKPGFAASEELLRDSAVKMALGEYEEAREFATRAVDSDPSNPRAYLQRAALHLRLDSLAEAAEDASKALGLRYEKPAAYCLRSEAYARQGRFQEALADAERAVGLNPNSPAGLFRRAVAREGLGAAREEVLSDLKRASELDAQFRPHYEAALRRSSAPKPRPRDSAKRVLAWASGLAVVLAAAFWAMAQMGSRPSWSGQKARLVRFGTTLEGGRLAEEPALGSVVGGRFILDALVERTDQGAVYEGRDLADEPRTIVCYRNRDGLAGRARAAAGLRHPQIAASEALFEQGVYLYLVYQPVPGDSLRRVLEGLPQRRCSPEQALRLLKPICEALEWAHGHGLSHGHLNPCCIVVDKGQVVLRDFGVTPDPSARAYLAPEQETASPSREADLFSLGVCLYEMLSGALPFQEPEGAAKREGRLPDASQPQGLHGIDEFFTRALCPDPARRFGSASELYVAFRSLVVPVVQ